ncbi:MAG TPA: sigma-70 family RNA polymerase sigma factor [Acidimicrobiales bacterium]|nr:sigma-70 family RNA polymerase sigma factor [Acidimicrobiales bacterium]
MTDLAPRFALDGTAVTAALEPHRPGLTAHCYRMLGSAFDAEDALQETFVRAWRGIDRFEGRAELRSWLYRIATNVCLDMLAGRARRALPMSLEPPSSGRSDLGEPLGEATWVTPIPDRLVLASDSDPATSVVGRDSIRLAFVAALQHLQPKPRAVLLLRDVLGWHAAEVADLLDTTVTAVNSMLRRARQTMAERDTSRDAGTGMGESEWGVVARYVDAFQRFDIEALVALLRDDAILSMPPIPGWLRGRAAIGQHWHSHGSACRGSRLRLTGANGRHALGAYRPGPDGDHHAFGITVLEISGGRITALHAFLEPRLFPLFALPDRLLGDEVHGRSA